ncbi:hypothetical protein P3T36_007506 [Kitasatospora sp. MAP12-15]|nr:hypothetical protein [Kitasatospora sp. MAP12-44]
MQSPRSTASSATATIKRHGFTKRYGFPDVRTRVIPSPERGALGTLLITARTAA